MGLSTLLSPSAGALHDGSVSSAGVLGEVETAGRLPRAGAGWSTVASASRASSYAQSHSYRLGISASFASKSRSHESRIGVCRLDGRQLYAVGCEGDYRAVVSPPTRAMMLSRSSASCRKASLRVGVTTTADRSASYAARVGGGVLGLLTPDRLSSTISTSRALKEGRCAISLLEAGSEVSFVACASLPPLTADFRRLRATLSANSHRAPNSINCGSRTCGRPVVQSSLSLSPGAAHLRRRLPTLRLRRGSLCVCSAGSASDSNGISGKNGVNGSNGVSTETAAESGRLRSFVQRLERAWRNVGTESGNSELVRKFIPLAVLFFFASFNYSILRDTKDALIVTAKGGGVEQIPFLTTYFVLPFSVLLVVGYGWLCATLPPHLVFYATIAPFIAYFVTFITALYPMQDILHPHGLADHMLTVLPKGVHGLVSIFRNWTFSLFYIVSELWGGVVISLLFWGLANDVCTMEEARVLYPLLGISANVALVFAGRFLKHIAAQRSTLATATEGAFDAWGYSLRILVGTVLLCSAAMCAMNFYIHRSIIGRHSAQIDQAAAEQISSSTSPAVPAAAGAEKKSKPKLSFKESFKVLVDYPQVRNLALVVVAYGISTSLFDVSWKHQLRQLYKTPQAYGTVLAEVSTATGILTIGLMLMSRYIFSIFGWGVAAAITPAVMAATGFVFFSVSIFKFSSTGLGTAVLAGSAQQAIAKAAKYSLFDPAKEMVFICLPKDAKTKGKAAVDLVGSQLGKSGGSWITQALLLAVGSLSTSLPIIAGVYGLVILLWLNAARELHRLLKSPNPAFGEAKGGLEVGGEKSGESHSGEGKQAAYNPLSDSGPSGHGEAEGKGMAAISQA